MVTRTQNGTIKPKVIFSLHGTISNTFPHEPKFLHEACQDPHWQAAMKEELNALARNHMWTRVPRPPRVNVIGSH